MPQVGHFSSGTVIAWICVSWRQWIELKHWPGFVELHGITCYMVESFTHFKICALKIDWVTRSVSALKVLSPTSLSENSGMKQCSSLLTRSSFRRKRWSFGAFGWARTRRKKSWTVGRFSLILFDVVVLYTHGSIYPIVEYQGSVRCQISVVAGLSSVLTISSGFRFACCSLGVCIFGPRFDFFYNFFGLRSDFFFEFFGLRSEFFGLRFDFFGLR